VEIPSGGSSLMIKFFNDRGALYLNHGIIMDGDNGNGGWYRGVVWVCGG
jgi:hypothetical protein